MPGPLPLKRIHHIELIVGNAKQAAYYYRKAFGFTQKEYLGPETGVRNRASYLLSEYNVNLVLTTPLTAEDPMNLFLTLHGDGVKDIAFEVEDCEAVYREAVGRGAQSAMAPTEFKDESGVIKRASVRTYGDVIHSFIEKGKFTGAFLPGFKEEVREGVNFGFRRIDHIVGNAEDKQMDRWSDWYIQTLGFHQFLSFDDKDISTDYSALRSKVMSSEDGLIKFPINEPAPGKIKSQIQEYIDFNRTAGVQHIALLTNDIISTVSTMRENGVEFLDVPDSYYDDVWDRVGAIDEDRERIRENKILVDRDEKGYLLQLFTKPVEDRPTLFFEVIQRRGCQSFGKGNFKALFESIEREQKRRGNL